MSVSMGEMLGRKAVSIDSTCCLFCAKWQRILRNVCVLVLFLDLIIMYLNWGVWFESRSEQRFCDLEEKETKIIDFTHKKFCTSENISTLPNDQLDAQFFYFIIRLLQSSTCFEQRRAHHQEVQLC